MTISINEVTTILTALVAVVGLILSIYNFYVDRRDKMPRLDAKISNGFLTSGPEIGDLMLLLEIANPGEKVVKITAVEIKLKKHKLVFIRGIRGTERIPFELPPGNSATFWTPLKEVAFRLKEEGHRGRESIRACFRTAIGNEFISKKFAVDIDEWAKSN